jgi:hypothetical protein
VEIDYDDAPEESRMASRLNRVPRDNKGDGTNSRAAWWNRGHIIEADDTALHPENLGLGERERKGFSEENTHPWGMRMFAESEIVRRALEADHRPGRLERLARWARGEPWDGSDNSARAGY